MKNSESGFTLIELLIVIAIIGILAAVALPMYQGQAVRAKLAEVEHAMEIIESAVTAYHQDTATWPNVGSINDVQTSLGVGLAATTRIAGVTVVNGVIAATVQNIDPLVNMKTLSLTPSVITDGSITWTWGSSADFPVHLRPRGN